MNEKPSKVQLVKVQSMTLNEDFYVCLANDLIVGKQKSMSVWASRILNFLVMQLIGDESELGTYTVRIQKLANFVDLDSSSGTIYQNIKKAVKEIQETVIEISTGNPKDAWKMFHWMKTAEYDGDGNLTLALSDEVKPYLLDLKSRGWFTQYQIKEILPMSSFYAIRLYQYISLVDKKSRTSVDSFTITIEQLREYLQCTTKFKQIGELKKRVIDVAQKQINANKNSAYWIDVDYIKTGRTVTSVKFTIHDGEFIRRHALPQIKGQTKIDV